MKTIAKCLLLTVLTAVAAFGTACPAHGQGFRLLLRRANCIIFGGGSSAPQTDPALVALLARVAAQQDALAAQQQSLAIQLATRQATPVVPQTDPQFAILVAQLTARQDVVIDLLRQGKTTDPALAASLQQLVAGQERVLAGQDRMLAALQDLCKHQAGPTPSPVIVVPPPPAGGTGTLPGIPGAGAALQTIPLPGGALQIVPPVGQKLQAIPLPGGGLQVIPGGPVTPPSGGSVPETPGAGGIIVIPGAGGVVPMAPLPGAPPGTVFRYHTTLNQKRK